MRLLVVLLLLAATAKVATLQWLRRSASDDVIISAYRPRALEACAGEARRLGLSTEAAAWKSDPTILLEFGRGARGIAFWRVDDPAWFDRYRNPYLHLETAGATPPQVCNYDIVGATATLHRPGLTAEVAAAPDKVKNLLNTVNRR